MSWYTFIHISLLLPHNRHKLSSLLFILVVETSTLQRIRLQLQTLCDVIAVTNSVHRKTHSSSKAAIYTLAHRGDKPLLVIIACHMLCQHINDEKRSKVIAGVLGKSYTKKWLKTDQVDLINRDIKVAQKSSERRSRYTAGAISVAVVVNQGNPLCSC